MTVEGNTGGTALMGYNMSTDRHRCARWVNRTDHTKVEAIEP
jgi:hypothetical protein